MQSLPPKPQSGNDGLILFVFRCGALSSNEIEILYSGSVITDFDGFFAIIIEIDFDAGRLSIDGVVDQLLDAVRKGSDNLLST